jgi:hypothetical protein
MSEIGIAAYLAPSRLEKNRLIFITVKGLKAVDGSVLSGPISLYFATSASPLYSTIMRVRMRAGEFLENVPDITLLQLIKFFSEEADLLNFSTEIAAGNANYANYRARWTTLSVVLALLSGSTANSLMLKRLGDLSIRRDGAAQELLDEVRRQLRELTEVLEDGGIFCREAEAAVKGINHPDRPALGRRWTSADRFPTAGIPAANTRELFVRTSDGSSETKVRRTYKSKP